MNSNLKRVIGKWDLVLLMINSLVGFGIFGLPAKIFNQAGTINTVMLIGSLVPFALALEEQLPGFLQFIHKKLQTPTWSLGLFAGVAFVVSASGTFVYAVSISVISKVLILGIVCAALPRLRKMNIRNEAFFKIPYGKMFSVFGIIICIGLLLSSEAREFRDSVITLFAGVITYYLYRFRKRKKNYKMKLRNFSHFYFFALVILLFLK